MRTIVLLVCCLISQATAFDLQTDVQSGSFTSESHPRDENRVRRQDSRLTMGLNGTWAGYKSFDFGSGCRYFWIEVASNKPDAMIELRLGSATGTLIGTVVVTDTGGGVNYKPFAINLDTPVKGKHDLYLKFVGIEGVVVNVARFRFQRVGPEYKPIKMDEWEMPVLAEELKAAGNFNVESDPSDRDRVRNDEGRISYIQNGTWVGYKDFDFGNDSHYFFLEASSESNNGSVELRAGYPDGALIGTVVIENTGSFKTFNTFGINLPKAVSGTRDLYLKFKGQGGYIFDVRSFGFLPLPPGRKSTGSVFAVNKFEKESHPNGEPIISDKTEISSVKNGSWVAYSNFDFGQDTDLFTIEAATPNQGGVIEVRTETAKGPLIATVKIHYTGSWSHYRRFTAKLPIPISGKHHLFLRFVSYGNDSEPLFNLRSFIFGRKKQQSTEIASEGKIHVYPPVPGLDASPYYKFSIQKIDSLNAPKKQDATNWEEPFAWFTKCVDEIPNRNTAYYEEFIGSWSHTYCNFEMSSNTPIVVKITRLNKSGAPSGPITLASAHPAHKVSSCEVINGDVYVTMSQPALVAIDIDGQMDCRDAPRAIPNEWGSAPFPFRNEMQAAHGVTIFANPFLEDKPKLNDPNVHYVEPGKLPPTEGSWTTLYFMPGVHKLSVEQNGNEREWKPSDALYLQNNKSYYIPGDAVVYGNFNDHDDSLASTNIRVFGHGTLCGTKIPHWKDFSFGELPENERKKLRMLQLGKSSGCTYEGITIADPAEHGAYIEGAGGDHKPNKMSWLKNITWRVNNDGGGVTDNGTVEDCFFRHQDDALYVRGVAIRRCVLWSDVNGTPLRCSFITNDRGAKFPSTLPEDLVVEDVDVIYARGVFASEKDADFGIIGTPGAFNDTQKYADGTLNTGQHVVFRNIRVSDPRPTRYLFGFNATGDASDQQKTPWAGLRFENVEYQHPQTWGWRNHLLGTNAAAIRYWLFNRVQINGKKLDAQTFANPKLFETRNVSDMIFR